MSYATRYVLQIPLIVLATSLSISGVARSEVAAISSLKCKCGSESGR